MKKLCACVMVAAALYACDALSETRPICIDRADFGNIVPRIDAIANRLEGLRLVASPGPADDGIYQDAAMLLRVQARLLMFSEWACAAPMPRAIHRGYAAGH